jgi:hypothetical protein
VAQGSPTTTPKIIWERSKLQGFTVKLQSLGYSTKITPEELKIGS